MKKLILLPIALGISTTAYSQIGINTPVPQATLDIAGSPTDVEKYDGVIAPRITGAQLRAKTYTSSQTGAIVYVTAADNTPTDQTVNITSTGYYYFDGNLWQSLKEGEPWKVSGTTKNATSNTQNIYQMGKLGIGVNPGTSPIANLEIEEINYSGESGISYGVYNKLISNRQGTKTGIANLVYDNSTGGSGENTGISSGTIDASTVARSGRGGEISYTLQGTKDNGILTHVHGLSNSITLSASGGDLTTGYSYANIANAYGYTPGGNLTTNDLRAYSGYAIPNPSAGKTFTSQHIVGAHITARPQGEGTVNVTHAYGVSAQFDPQITGTYTGKSVTALRSYINFLGTANYSIQNIYGLLIEKGPNDNGTKIINNTYGIYIDPFSFLGSSAVSTYNLYSAGTTTKNYFQGKVGIGEGAKSPASNLKVTGLQNFADNTGALNAGLEIGDFYHTDGVVKVVY